MRRFFLVAYLTVTALIIAHLLNAFVVDLLTLPTNSSSVPQVNPDRQSRENVDRFNEHIIATNLFGVASAGAQNGNASSQDLSTSEASKAVRLIGTVISDGRLPFVVLEDINGNKQRLYKLHEDIPGIGKIVSVRQDGVTIRAGGHDEFLKSTISETVTAASGKKLAMPEAGAPGRMRRLMDRREIVQAMNDLPRLLSQARAVPAYLNGDLYGWRIEGIAPKSFFDKIGLKAGDVLQRVNGVSIKDPGTILTIFQQVKDESNVQLDLIRQNQKVSMMYDVR